MVVTSPRLLCLLTLCLVAACSGGGNGSDDDGTSDADAAVSSQCIASCSSPNMCCRVNGGDFCLAVASDRDNCGGCGIKCDPTSSNSCGGGQCRCNAGPACGDGSACCGDGCKNLMTDAQNCGMCGHHCGTGETCSNGQCTCNGLVCGAGQSCCGGTCVDTMGDEANCGQCGMACSGMLDTCNNGVCGCASGGGACPAPGPLVSAMCCASGCVDVNADAMNCGTCGHACTVPLCLFGQCIGDTVDAGVP